MSPTSGAHWGFRSSVDLGFTERSIVDEHFEACRAEYLGLLARVPVPEGAHVLDAGCGAGAFLPALADLVGASGRITAVDLAPEHVEAVGDLALPCPLSVRVADLRALPLADDSVDVAWCSNVVQYLDDDALARALAELRRVVRPGGTVAIKELDASSITVRPADPFLFVDFFRSAAVRDGYARQLLRSRDLHHHLAEAGFEAVAQRTVLIERYGPLDPASRRYFGRACADLARQAGGRGDWARFLSADDHPLDSPRAYACEGAVLAVGTVPA